MNDCPSVEVLQQLLDEQLPSAAQSDVENHVEGCPACQSQLARLTPLSLQVAQAVARPLDATADFQPASTPSVEPFVPANADTSITRDTGTSPAVFPAVASAPPSAARPVPSLPGYELLEKLGEGGMGVVFKARHLKLNRFVALKMVLSAHLATDDQIKRFYAEAEAAAHLEHSGIVPVFEVGQHEGQHFLAMAYVDGPSLWQKIKDGPLEPRAAAELLRQVALAVHHAHEQGIVHRDLKPHNILLTKDGEPRVTDFGLAKNIAADSGLTATGQIMGTPSYMPPEQAAGKMNEVGLPADIYSLGATLYCTLTGRPPFQAATLPETLHQVAHSEPVSPRVLNPSVDRDLETICLKCLQKDPARRYATAADLSADLQHFLRHEPIRARPVNRPERLRRWCRRNPAIAALSAAVVLVLLIGISFTSYFAFEADSRAQYALAQMTRADTNAETANRKTQDERRERQRADENAKLAFRQLYAVQMNMMQRDLELGSFGGLLDRLEQTRPGQMGGQDLRDFEWYFWQRRCHSHLHRLIGHRAAVWSLSFSSDGRWLASGDAAGMIHVWETATGRTMDTFNAHAGRIINVSLSPDGSRLASIGEDGIVRVSDRAGRNTALMLKRHAIGAAWSPDGQSLALGTYNSIEVYRLGVQNGRTLSGHSGPVTNIVFSKDGTQLASASHDRTVRVWDVETTNELFAFRGHLQPVIWLAFCPDDNQVVSASLDRTVKLWNTVSGEESGTLKLASHKSGITCVAFGSDGNRLATTASQDGTVKVWNIESGQEELTIVGSDSVVNRVTFSPDGRLLASAGDDGRVMVWDATNGQNPQTLCGSTTYSDLAFSADGKLLAASSRQLKTIKLWDVSSGQNTATINADAILRLAFSADGKRLVWFSQDGTVKSWNAEHGKVVDLFALDEYCGWIKQVKLSANGERLACSLSTTLSNNAPTKAQKPPAADDRIKVWDVKNTSETNTFKGKATEITHLALSCDGHWLAASEYALGPSGFPSGGSKLKLWNATNGNVVFALDAAERVVAFSSDGRRLAVCDSNDLSPILKLRDSTSGDEVLVLKGHAGRIMDVAFSPVGNRLASASLDKTVKIWDTTSGHVLLTLFLEAPGIAIAFSPDGKRLALATREGVKIFDARPWTSELRMEQQAVSLLRFLRAKSLSQSALLDAIASDETISEPVRDLALKFARIEQ